MRLDQNFGGRRAEREGERDDHIMREGHAPEVRNRGARAGRVGVKPRRTVAVVKPDVQEWNGTLRRAVW